MSDFESYNFTLKSYDLLFSAEAYHWIDTSKWMVLAASAIREGGFNRTELNRIATHVLEHQEAFMERWHEFFSD